MSAITAAVAAEGSGEWLPRGVDAPTSMGYSENLLVRINILGAAVVAS